ncbi:Alpha/Beta hydrolase protein [Phyllosticta capitalensis]
MGDKGYNDVDMLDEGLDEKPTKNSRPFQDDTASKKRQKTGIDHASQQPHSNDATTNDATSKMIPGCHIYPPIREHMGTIIFLHDQNTTTEACSRSFFQRSKDAGCDLRWALPNHQWIFSTSGRRDPSWFDQQQPLAGDSAKEPPAETQAHRAGVCASLGDLFHIIDAQANAVGSHNVALVGMGQGAAVAAVAFLTGWHAVDCFVGMAGWLPCQAQVDQLICDSKDVVEAQRRMRDFFPPPEERDRPSWFGSLGKSVLLVECADDEVVPHARSTGLYQVLLDMSMQVQRHVYNMGGHEGVTESRAMEEVARFLIQWDMEHNS